MDVRYQRLSGVGDLKDSQKEDAHLPLLPSVLADNRKQTHIVNVPVGV